jgi:hypothetical protein
VAVKCLPIALAEAGTLHRLVIIRPKHSVGVAGRRTEDALGIAGRRTEDALGITLSASTEEIIATHLSSFVLLFSLLVFVFFFSLYPVSFPPASISTVINAFYSLRLGARGDVVVKALRYKPAGREFDSRWCY